MPFSSLESLEPANTLNLFISDKINSIFKGQKIIQTYVSLCHSDLENHFGL